jgi:two-component system, cell cycle sensor histidine kinase and response regulator CckA
MPKECQESHCFGDYNGIIIGCSAGFLIMDLAKLIKPFLYNSFSKKDIVTIGALGLVYFVIHGITYVFPDFRPVFSAIWLAGGIGLAVLLLSPRSLWPPLIEVFFVAGVCADVLLGGKPILSSCGFMAISVLEYFGCAWIITLWCGERVRFIRTIEVVALIASVASVGLVCASAGAILAVLTRQSTFLDFWATWYVSKALGLLIFGPFLVSWLHLKEWRHESRWFWDLELLIFMSVWIAASWYAFDATSLPTILSSHPYMIVTLLVWGALRLGQRGVTLGLFTLSVILVTSKSVIEGPMIWGGQILSERILLSQLFLGLTGATGMLLAAGYSQAKTAERLARDRETRLQAIGDNLPDGIVYEMVDEGNEKLHFSYISAGAERLWGISVADMMADMRAFLDRIPEEDRHILEGERDRAIKEMSSISATVRFVKPDGTLRWIHFLSTPRRLMGGTIVWDGIALDETEQKHVEEALLEKTLELDRYFNSARDLLCIADKRGVFKKVNSQWERTLGYFPRDVQGKNFLNFVHPEDKKTTKDIFSELLSQKVLYGFVNRCLHKNGSYRWIEWSDYLRGDTIYAVGRDITERRKTEEDRVVMSKLESIGILAGGIAHDFNNLLTAIIGNIEMARISEASGKSADVFLESSLKAAWSASGLANQFISLSKGGKENMKTVSLGDIVRDSVTLTLTGSSCLPVFSIPSDLWQIRGDTEQIGQAIRNVVQNACESMIEGGKILVVAENMKVNSRLGVSLSEGEYVKVSVIDKGCGIPSDFVSKIFDPYFSTKQRGSAKGMGLGLTITHAVVKKHGGTVTVDSQIGLGTTVSVYFPAHVDASVQSITPLAASDKGAARILIMDDELSVREVAGALLTKLGYDVETAGDGTTALTLFQQAIDKNGPFDLVMLDLTVKGGMGGVETLRNMCEIDPLVKAIVVSGYSEDPVIADYQKYGFVAAISKPWNIDIFKDVIKRVLKH